MAARHAKASRSPPPRSESPLAFSKRPSYLKRQKEQQRLARAAEKRDARRARKNAKDLPVHDGEATDDPGMPMGSEAGTEDTGAEADAEESAAE